MQGFWISTFIEEKDISKFAYKIVRTMKTKTLLIGMMAALFMWSCSNSDDDPITRIGTEEVTNTIDNNSMAGVWQIASIRNEYGAAVNWDNWQDYYGEIFLTFNADGSCSTNYQNPPAFIEERQQQGLPDFPYIYNNYKIEGKNICCYKSSSDDFLATVFEVKTITNDKAEVVLQQGMYCMLSSASQPQLRMVWKRVS